MTISTFSTRDDKSLASETARMQLSNALSELYRALKSVTFYPERHPLREENKQKALSALKNALPAEGVTLEIGRNGLTVAGALLTGGDMVRALGQELLLRRVRTLTMLAELIPQDLEIFLKVTATDPLEVAKAGGLEKMLASQGVATIKITDLTVIGLDTSSADGKWKTSENERTAGTGDKAAPPQEKPEEQDLRELIAKLDRASTDTEYIRHASLLAQKAHELKHSGNLEAIIPALMVLMLHVKEEKRSQEQRECALFTLDQVASGNMTEIIIKRLQSTDKEQETFLEIVRLLGSRMAPPLLQKLISPSEGKGRIIATALVRIGYPAVPTLIASIGEKRMDLVPEVLAILGDIGSKESIPPLQKVAHFQDGRMAQEALRAMAKIGGSEAESSLISLLSNAPNEKARQIIYLLGLMKSRAAVPILVERLLKKDTFLRDLEVKKEIVYSLGRIGDTRVTPIFTSIVEKRRLLAKKLWEELQIAIIDAFVFLRDQSVIPVLKKLSKRGRLHRACMNTIKVLEEEASNAG